MQGEADGDRARQLFAVAHPGGVAVGEPPIFGKRGPDSLTVSLREEGGLVGDLNAGGFEGRDGKLTVPFIQRAAVIPSAVEHDALHGAGSTCWFTDEAIVVSLIWRSLEVMGEGAKPSAHIRLFDVTRLRSGARVRDP